MLTADEVDRRAAQAFVQSVYDVSVAVQPEDWYAAERTAARGGERRVGTCDWYLAPPALALGGKNRELLLLGEEDRLLTNSREAERQISFKEDVPRLSFEKKRRLSSDKDGQLRPVEEGRRSSSASYSQSSNEGISRRRSEQRRPNNEEQPPRQLNAVEQRQATSPGNDGKQDGSRKTRNYVFVFYNPASGDNAANVLADPALSRAVLYYGTKCVQLNLFDIRSPELGKNPGFLKLKKIVDETEASRLETSIRVVVGGGDGTVMWCISELRSYDIDLRRVAIGVIPFGTGDWESFC